MARPSRTAIQEHDRTFIWKLLLRVLAILFAAVAIGTIAWAITAVPYNGNAAAAIEEEAYYIGPDYFYYGYTMLLPWILIPLGLSVIWNIVNLIVLLARNRWIHPGANVGCDLVLWLGLGVTAGIATVGAVSYLVYEDYYYNDTYDIGYGGGIFPNGTSYYTTADGTDVAYCTDGSCGATDSFNALVRHVGVVVMVGCAFAWIIMLFHFALFVSACRYTHARRHTTYSARHTSAITEEATQIARRMIAEMTTGPNGGFIPINNQQMQRQQPGSQQQPMQQQQRDVPGTPETLHTAERWAVPLPPPQVLVDRPAAEGGRTLR